VSKGKYGHERDFITITSRTAMICGLLTVGFTYVGYPVVIQLAAAKAKKCSPGVPDDLDSSLPKLSVVIPAFNEERFITQKITGHASPELPAGRS
jgi:hypothetical protein